jgi:hypothetical protein
MVPAWPQALSHRGVFSEGSRRLLWGCDLGDVEEIRPEIEIQATIIPYSQKNLYSYSLPLGLACRIPFPSLAKTVQIRNLLSRFPRCSHVYQNTVQDQTYGPTPTGRKALQLTNNKPIQHLSQAY